MRTSEDATAYVIHCTEEVEELRVVLNPRGGGFETAFRTICEAEFGDEPLRVDRIGDTLGLVYPMSCSVRNEFFKSLYGYRQFGKVVAFGYDGDSNSICDAPDPHGREFLDTFAKYVRRKSLVWRGVEECGLMTYHSSLERTSEPILAKGAEVDLWSLDPVGMRTSRDWRRKIGPAIRGVVEGKGMWPCDTCRRVDFCNDTCCGFGCRICDDCKDKFRYSRSCGVCRRSLPSCSGR